VTSLSQGGRGRDRGSQRPASHQRQSTAAATSSSSVSIRPRHITPHHEALHESEEEEDEATINPMMIQSRPRQ
jgi:hypothetical protein